MPLRIILLLTFFQACAPVLAKRFAPNPVKPVSHAGLRYEVLHWFTEGKDRKQNGGYVRLVNKRNGMTICDQQIYDTKYDKNLESDIQDNFITSLKVDKDALLIDSEKLPPIRRPFEGFCN